MKIFENESEFFETRETIKKSSENSVFINMRLHSDHKRLDRRCLYRAFWEGGQTISRESKVLELFSCFADVFHNFTVKIIVNVEIPDTLVRKNRKTEEIQVGSGVWLNSQNL